MTDLRKLSRRDWLIAVGSAAAAPLISRSAHAAISMDHPKPEGVHRILSCNILLALPEQKGKTSWEKHRREVCFKIIKSRQPDIFCLQEVGRKQNGEFIKEFPDFESFGFVDPASDTNPRRFKAIRNVIFYSKERYEMTAASSYWLSDTPLIAASKYDKQRLERQVNWVRLRDKKSGKEFRVMDTHFALDQPNRQKEAELIAKESSQYQPDFPQLIAGDFNSQYKSSEIQTLLKAGWKDSYSAVNDMAQLPVKKKIDFIFYRGKVTPVASAMILDKEDGVKPSDHPFVSADVKLD